MPVQKIRSYLFNFFHFNKQERNGVFVLCLIIVVLFVIRLLMPWMSRDKNHVQLTKVNVDAFEVTVENDKKPTEELKHNMLVSVQRFVFNPNTVTEEDAQKLGFSKKLSATLVNFRNRGGKFFKTEDLKKLYGLSPELYQELESYILIPQKEYKRDSAFANKPHAYEKKNFTRELVEINTADSLSIVYLKGIGPGFTKRIIKYRSMLGGFHSINQLMEVYGMTDSLYLSLSSQIKLDANALIKIPINAIDFNSLRKHPYFNFQSAQAVINFRSKHGKLTENDLRGLGVFSDEKLRLILPYLNY
ncbi:MAG: helix-hairpin-helix domain-containing protein [Bacteroidota bacterium]